MDSKFRYYICTEELDKSVTCHKVTKDLFEIHDALKAKICGYKDDFLDPGFLSWKLGRKIKVSRE